VTKPPGRFAESGPARKGPRKTEHSLPITLQWDENLDIRSDTGTPVNDADYQVPFKFTGKINKITLTIDRPKLTPEDIKKLEEGSAGQEGKRVGFC